MRRRPLEVGLPEARIHPAVAPHPEAEIGRCQAGRGFAIAKGDHRQIGGRRVGIGPCLCLSEVFEFGDHDAAGETGLAG